MNAINATTASGLPEAGVAEVVDGRTGALIWRFEPPRARSYLEVRAAMPLFDAGAPNPLVLATKMRMAERVELDSYRYSVWVGGKDGKEITGPRMPWPSAPALVRPMAGDAPLALLVYRCGVWQDGFVGIERYEVGETELKLTHRVAMDHPPVHSIAPQPTIDFSATQVGDLDDDGWCDVAFLALPKADEVACIFVSGKDGSLLGCVPGIRQGLKWLSRLLWLPACSGQPAQLLLTNMVSQPGDAGPVLGRIIPPHPIRR